MCTQLEHIILTTTKHGQVSWCKGCRNFSVIYNSCCLAFCEKEMLQFQQFLDTLDVHDFKFEFLEEPHVLIKNPHASMGLCLNETDLFEFKAMLQEAVTINEVFGILYD